MVVGRSNIVGKPMAQLLLQANCTVTVAHSRTRDLPDAVRRADIVVAAVGRPELIRGDWLKPGATVIDVGQERVEQPDGTRKLLGDLGLELAARVLRVVDQQVGASAQVEHLVGDLQGPVVGLLVVGDVGHDHALVLDAVAVGQADVGHGPGGDHHVADGEPRVGDGVEGHVTGQVGHRDREVRRRHELVERVGQGLGVLGRARRRRGSTRGAAPA